MGSTHGASRKLALAMLVFYLALALCGCIVSAADAAADGGNGQVAAAKDSPADGGNKQVASANNDHAVAKDARQYRRMARLMLRTPRPKARTAVSQRRVRKHRHRATRTQGTQRSASMRQTAAI
ncbi:hypothetical protein DL89DRAFT_282625, partial [Linderina pennispora]